MPKGIAWYFAYDHSTVMLERRGGSPKESKDPVPDCLLLSLLCSSHFSLYPQKLTHFSLQHLGRGYSLSSTQSHKFTRKNQ